MVLTGQRDYRSKIMKNLRAGLAVVKSPAGGILNIVADSPYFSREITRNNLPGEHTSYTLEAG